MNKTKTTIGVSAIAVAGVASFIALSPNGESQERQPPPIRLMLDDETPLPDDAITTETVLVRVPVTRRVFKVDPVLKVRYSTSETIFVPRPLVDDDGRTVTRQVLDTEKYEFDEETGELRPRTR